MIRNVASIRPLALLLALTVAALLGGCGQETQTMEGPKTAPGTANLPGNVPESVRGAVATPPANAPIPESVRSTTGGGNAGG